MMWKGKFGKYELTMDDEDRNKLLKKFDLSGGNVWLEYDDYYELMHVCICHRYYNSGCIGCPCRYINDMPESCRILLEQYDGYEVIRAYCKWYKGDDAKARAFIAAVRNDLLAMREVTP